MSARDADTGLQQLFLIDPARVRLGDKVVRWRGRAGTPQPPTGDDLAWSPDGAWLLLLIDAPADPGAFELVLVDMRGESPGEPVGLPGSPTRDGGRDTNTEYWSPDSQRIVLKAAPLEQALLVFDVNSPQQGPIWQAQVAEPSAPGTWGPPFASWTAANSLLFHDGTTLSVEPLKGGLEATAISLADGSSNSHLLLSPDRKKLVYRSYRGASASSPLQMLAFDSLETQVVRFQGSAGRLSDHVQWLADSSGLVALTSSTGAVADQATCAADDCRLEYVFLSADGQLQSAQTAIGRATAESPRGGLLPQP